MANYVLEILDGDRAGDVLSLSDRPIRIGRKPGNDLVLHDEKTSGVHAEVVSEGGRYVLRDLGSTNGTFLDGKRVTEIVLSVGDVVTVGRLRVKFRGEGDAAAGGADTGDLSMHRIDAARLQKRSGVGGLLAALVLLGAGAGGYLWWQAQAGDEGQGAARQQRQAPVVVAGNKLAQALASCEAEEGWNLRTAGAGFQPSSRSNTGTGAFEAARGDGAEAADFAVATLQEALPVLTGRTLTIRAFARTDGGAEAALRAVFFAANDGNPFRFRTGTLVAPANGWSPLELVLAVPQGCDRLQLELVAALPASGAAVGFDDVAVVEQGQATATDSKLAESKQTAIGTGTAFVVRSTDPDNPATVLGVLPGKVRKELEALHKAGFGALSDVVTKWECTPTERSFQLSAQGVDSLEFVFPAEAAGNLLARNGEAFASLAADSAFEAQAVLLGDRATRALLQCSQPVACSGRSGGGLYRLVVGGNAVELGLGFAAERQQAIGLLEQARRAAQAGQPGEALDRVRELAGKVPHDSEILGQARAQRAQLLAEQADALKRLQDDLAEAAFFDTRGGFQRVLSGVDEVLSRYGEHNVEDLPLAQQLREQASQRLAAMATAEHDSQRARLEAMAKALAGAQQQGLAGVVQDYVNRHLGTK
jgi:hypothetical protein